MTDTELTDIAAAAIIGDSNTPNHGYSTPAAIGTPERVVAEREQQVLADVAHRRARQRARADDAAQIALDQRDARALHRDVGPGSHRDADVGGAPAPARR